MEPLNDYEKQRQQRIAVNKQRLASLGLANAAAQLGGSGPMAGASVRRSRRRAGACGRARRSARRPGVLPCRVARSGGLSRASAVPNAERAVPRLPAQAGQRQTASWRRGRRACTAARRQRCVARARRACRGSAGAPRLRCAKRLTPRVALANQASEDLQPTRISKRKRGEAAAPTDGEAGERPEPAARKADCDDDAPAGPRARIPFPEPRADLTVVGPFSLRSIGCVASPRYVLAPRADVCAAQRHRVGAGRGAARQLRAALLVLQGLPVPPRLHGGLPRLQGASTQRRRGCFLPAPR